MFKQFEEYMALLKEERQSHLILDEPCVEIGTNSQQCRALLAHRLRTTVPKGMKVHLCHACNNGKCSNPNHLYWGTAKENQLDSNFQEKGAAATRGKTWSHSRQAAEKIKKARTGKPSNNKSGVNQFSD